jgi:predicted ABC-type ATPase
MFMLVGPNGAGKSTLYETRIKPTTAAPFINADQIQRDELKDSSMAAAYKAAEIAETRRREHLAQRKDFVSESTFSHPSKLDLVADAKAAGFRVVVYHVNLRSPELSVHRVASRFQEGGHDVPEDKIRERFERNPALIREAVRMADRAYVYDNSKLNSKPALVIRFKDGHATQIADNVPTWARDLYSQDLSHFSPARLNPAAASFADAKTIADKLAGGDAQVKVADVRQARVYSGTLVGESSLHWLQHGDDGFVAHFKSSVKGDVELRRQYQIKYSQANVAAAELVQPDRQKLMADAFRRGGDQKEVVKAYPELANAYVALDYVAQRAKDMEPAKREQAIAQAKAQIAADLEAPKQLKNQEVAPPVPRRGRDIDR